jgi:tRNA(fMet)-specific endonuclease VapC
MALVGDLNVCTSIVVAVELLYGAIKKNSPRLTNQIEAVLGAMEVLPLEVPVDREYGRLRARLERNGQPIGGNDLLIAAQSVVLGLTLVTENQHEFSRISELSCENWLR